jgi:hypothetical protein
MAETEMMDAASDVAIIFLAKWLNNLIMNPQSLLPALFRCSRGCIILGYIPYQAIQLQVIFLRQ